MDLGEELMLEGWEIGTTCCELFEGMCFGEGKYLLFYQLVENISI